MSLSVTSAPWQQVNMPALDLRRFLSVGLQEGVVGTGDLAVAQRAAGANMSVDIASGQAVVQGESITNQGLYYAYNDATFNLTGFTAANATNPRIDRVAIRLRDAFHGDAANDLAFVVLTGTATAGATLVNLTGAASVPNGHLLLANVLIPATATTVTTANIGDQRTQSSTAAPPTGTVLTYAGATAPAGYLIADGTAISRSSYSALFAITSTLYGSGDGSTTFNLPDLRGRAAVGYAASGGHTDVATLGNNDGAALANRRPKHKHTVNVNSAADTTGSGATSWVARGQGTGNAGTYTIGGANDPTDSAAYVVVNYIVKT